MDGVLGLTMLSGPLSWFCCSVESGRELGPLIVLPLARLRLPRTVTVEGIWVVASDGPVLGEALDGVSTGAGNLDFAVLTRSVSCCILPWRL